jgi:sugar lactone lactonase YvrE
MRSVEPVIVLSHIGSQNSQFKRSADSPVRREAVALGEDIKEASAMNRNWTAEPVTNAAFLGESPRWDPAKSMLWWVDAHSDKGVLYRYEPAARKNTSAYEHRGLACVALRRDGTLLLGVDANLLKWSESPGLVTVEARVLADPGMVVNDCACDPRGRLWLDTITLSGNSFGDAGYLHRLEASVCPPKLKMAMGNGIGWSPDGKTMYVVDTHECIVMAIDYDADRGVLLSRVSNFVEKGCLR